MAVGINVLLGTVVWLGTGGSVAVYVREGLCSWLGSGVLLGLMGVLVSLPGSELAKPI